MTVGRDRPISTTAHTPGRTTRQLGTDPLALALGAAGVTQGLVDRAQVAEPVQQLADGRPEAWPHLSHTASQT